jgi:hypothetical protein
LSYNFKTNRKMKKLLLLAGIALFSLTSNAQEENKGLEGTWWAAGGVALAQLPRGGRRTQLYHARGHNGEHTEGAVLNADNEAEQQKLLLIAAREDDVGS